MQGVRIEGYRQFASDDPVVIIMVNGYRGIYDHNGVSSLVKRAQNHQDFETLQQALNTLLNLGQQRYHLKEIELDDLSGQEKLF